MMCPLSKLSTSPRVQHSGAPVKLSTSPVSLHPMAARACGAWLMLSALRSLSMADEPQLDRGARSLFLNGEVEQARSRRAVWERRAPSMLEAALNKQAGTDGDRANVNRFLRETDAALPVRNSRWDLLGPVGPTCTALDTFGNKPSKRSIADDEGKKACGLRRERDCTVMAIGSNGQWGFEEDLVARTNCTIHVFDCTSDKGQSTDVTLPYRLRGRVHLHSVCIGNMPLPSRSKFLTVPRNADGTPGPWSNRRWVNASFGQNDFGSYRQLLSVAGLRKPPTLLKMDAEGYEWDALPDAIAQPHLAPTQIAVEMHFQTQFPTLPWFGRFKSPAEILAFGNLLARSGYLLVDRNDNRACKWCSEQLWVRAGGNGAPPAQPAKSARVDRLPGRPPARPAKTSTRRGVTSAQRSSEPSDSPQAGNAPPRAADRQDTQPSSWIDSLWTFG